MSSQKGNLSRTRAQKHQNSIVFKNDKYGANATQKVTFTFSDSVDPRLWLAKDHESHHSKII